MNILNYRNAKEVKSPIFDVEIETAEFGWMPITINQSNIETELPHMVEISRWLINNPNKILMKTSSEMLIAAKDNKYSEILAYADSLSAIAENNFIANDNTSIAMTEKRNSKKHSKLLNKKLKSENLTSKENIWFDKYNKLLDYQDSVYDIADLTGDKIKNMGNTHDIIAYNVVNSPNWPK